MYRLFDKAMLGKLLALSLPEGMAEKVELTGTRKSGSNVCREKRKSWSLRPVPVPKNIAPRLRSSKLRTADDVDLR